MRKFWLLALIVILATLFRFVGLTSSPPGLNWDEVSIGYNAYSILKTGRDEWGEFLPLSFKAFGEHKLPAMIYASIPGIALFGTTDFAVRVTPAIIGLIGVVIIYLLGSRLFGHYKYGLIAGALLAISPWGVHFSRVSFEAGLAMVLTMLAIYFAIRAESSPRYFFLSTLSAVLALYSYNSVRILLPLLLLTYFLVGVIKLTKKSSKAVFSAVFLALVLAIPSILNLASKDGQIRWGTVAITDAGFFDRVAESRGYLASLPEPLPRLIHNKVTHLVTTIGDNYLKTFSTEFLFFQGSANTQRSIQGMGLLYLFELPLLLAGLYWLFKLKDSRPRKVLLPWLLLAPIASAITLDSPSSVRTLAMLPALLLIEALGFWALVKLPIFKHNLIRAASIILILWNISYFGYLLWFSYPVKFADDWQYGYKDVMSYLKEVDKNHDHIYITSEFGEPYIYTLFYLGYDPAKYQKLEISRNTDPLGWVHVLGFDKYHFTDYAGLESPTEIVARQQGSILMIAGFATLPGDYKRDFVLNSPTGRVMFEGTSQLVLQ